MIESAAVGGMGAQEAVPFSTREAAEKFVAEKGGRISTFVEMPEDYILGDQSVRTTDLGAESHAH